ncbi:MAG: hypothetical protein BGO26_10285 [Actinobacteria bacterium 69-20]|nr:hypothetical protein [Actinomycetota bacterium]OJV23285.1 MAG: hypothetical protein BGO26_10285 [Actinobacteria bacterium 69-20]
MADESAFRVEFNKEEFAGFLRALKTFEPALATATRRNLRHVGDETIADMRSVIAGGPGSGRYGVQAGIQAGLKTAVATGKRQQGVKISSTGAGLSPDRKPMLRLYNKSTFRHRIFGSDKWAAQSGAPYFGSVIKRHEDEMVEAVWKALEEAYDKMAETK